MSEINKEDFSEKVNGLDLKSEIYRYISFWPYILISVILFISSSFLYLRYVDYSFLINSKIQIIDEAQDSEMSLPTAMTIFNRSMVNLENEITILNSYKLHRKVVEEIDANIKFYNVGLIKNTEIHKSEFNDDIEFRLNSKYNPTEEHNFFISVVENKISVQWLESVDNPEIYQYNFSGVNTANEQNNLPFDLLINKSADEIEFKEKLIKIYPVDEIVDLFRQNYFKASQIGNESDQLILTFRSNNPLVGEEYLNKLMFEFDLDGINDSKLEYSRTIDFVDQRGLILEDELARIEEKKEVFKRENSLSDDISSRALVSMNQQLSYDNDIFKYQTQIDLIGIIKPTFNSDEDKLLPINIGIENSEINSLINQFNILFSEKETYLRSAGPNNIFVINLDDQLDRLKENIKLSLENYETSLKKQVNNFKSKEREFEAVFANIPENEKILRSIERELEVKESLFLLLLQKKEEAAINLAVVKPSIKIIDSARSVVSEILPNRLIVIASSILLGFLLPIMILYFWFILDTKIHTRENLENLIDIPIVSEIPYIKHIDDFKSELFNLKKKSPLLESIKMLIANLNFVVSDNKQNNRLIVTSTIKGEGKTLVAFGLAYELSLQKKNVLLLGLDLRNPQLHKFIGRNKDDKGLINFLIDDNNENYSEYIIKNKSIDVMISGTIPPNPTEFLKSQKFKRFIQSVSKKYDYIIFDTPPTLPVSDTLELSSLADKTLYIVRSNYTDKRLINHIKNIHKYKKLNNISLVLNFVGSSSAYGYKYGYQYGYNYAYNYGYGYKYNSD